MCAICGEIRKKGERASAATVDRMADRMAQRGPDGSGTVAQGSCSFAHRRLKIIDLTEHSQQPMIDSQLGLSLVYNGAIYNYPQLRKELEGKGYQFFSTGDTEVILKAYHAWGEACVERFNGMFAFAIRERDSGRVVLGRDRLGIKPLYYSESAGVFRFASTLPALLAVGEVDTSIDPVALNYYMSFHAVVPAPLTIIKGVRKLPPATMMFIEPDGSTRQKRYWQAGYDARPDEANITFEGWQDRVLESLQKAIQRRMIADVPVGVLLSGGLDSSLVVGLLADAGQKGLETFSIGFESVNDIQGDEFKYSDNIAKHYGTNHHQIRVDSARPLPALADCVESMSEPMVSHEVDDRFVRDDHARAFV